MKSYHYTKIIKYKFDIITRTKNRPLLLERTINSVISQKYQNWKHIIINDGGDSDDVDEIVSKYNELYNNRIEVIHNYDNRGMEYASNLAILSCKSEYIVVLDDDDSWHDSFLERVNDELNFKNGNEIEGVVTHTNQIFENISNSNIIPVNSRYLNPDLKNISLNRFRVVNLFMPVSFVFSRKSYEQLNGFDDEFIACGDWDFHYRFINKYKVKIIKEKLANYHIRLIDSDNSVSKKEIHNKYKNKFLTKHKIKKNVRWYLLYLTEIVIGKLNRYILREKERKNDK